MSESKLLHWDEAGIVMKSVPEPVKQRLVARAVTIALKKFRSGELAPGTSLDMKFLTEVILELFADPDVIQKELAGEKPGSWFEDE
jgi:hypothetical protein